MKDSSSSLHLPDYSVKESNKANLFSCPFIVIYCPNPPLGQYKVAKNNLILLSNIKNTFMIDLPKNLKITKINLSGLNLKEIPLEVFKYKNLRKLFLQNNKIKRIPQEINKLKLLKVLDISNNDLTSLHAKIFDLKNLEVLIANNNRIKNIPIQIRNLKKMRILGFANNRITDLNEKLSFVCNLKELNLSGNELKEFPYEILYQNKLERLWFCNYDFEIPSFTSLKKDLPYLKKVYKTSIIGNETQKNNNIKDDLGIISKEIVELKKRKKIFISYSHQDKEWLERIKIHLKVLKIYSESDFEVWDDERINAGRKWKEEIKKALHEATAAILLISTPFLASDFIQKEELQPLLKSANSDGTLILPLILKPCLFSKIESLNQFQAVNDPKTQILSRLSESDQEDILLKLTQEIEKHINE